MLRFASRLIVFLCLVAVAMADQTVNRSREFTKAEADDAVLTLAGTGVYNHRITWTGAGTRTSCSIKVEQSTDGTTFTDLITTQNCASDNTATVTGYANFVRIRVTTLTGSGNTVYAAYNGTPIQPSLGTVTVDTTGLATSSIQTNGAQKSQIVTSGGVTIDSFGGGTEYNSGDAKGSLTGKVMLGSDGTLVRALSLLSNGTVNVSLANNTANSTPVQVQSNSANLATATLQGGGLPAALGTGGGIKVDGSGTALPVSAASLPLPSGAATSALQGGGLPADLGAGGGVKVDGSGTALPVSGTVTANAGTNLNTSTLSTEATLAKLTVAQGASLGSNTQAMVGGSVTTAAPTYTNGQISPFTLTTKGTARFTLFDSAGNEVTNMGGGTQFANGAAIGTGVGNLMHGSVTTASPTYSTGTVAPFSLDTSGSVRVAIISGAGSGGTAMTDAGAFTAGVTSFTPSGGTYVAARAAITTGQGGTIALNAKRGQFVTLEDASSVALTGSAGSASAAVLTVQGISGGTTIPVTPAANSSVNFNQLAGTAVSTSNGTVDAGTQRVAVASNNTPFAVKTDQTTHGTTDKVAADLTQILGSAIGATNGLPVYPQTSSTWTVNGSTGTFPVTQTTATSLHTAADLYLGGTVVSLTAGVPIKNETGGSIKTAPLTADAEPGLARTNPPVPIAGSDYAGSPLVRIPKVDSSGNLYGLVAGTGTAGSPGTAALTIQGIGGGTAVPVSGTVTANGGGTAGSPAAGVTSVQGITSMTPLLVNGTGTAGAPASAVMTIQGVTSMTPVANNLTQILGSAVGATNGLPVYPQTSSVFTVTGSVAHDDADSGNPIKMGAKAVLTEPTAVSDGDRVNLTATSTGALLVRPSALLGDSWEYYAVTTNNSEVTIKAGEAGYYLCVTEWSVQNSSASVASTWTWTEATGGTAREGCYANTAGGGMARGDGSAPVFCTQTAANGIFAIAGTTGANLLVHARGFRTKIKPVI
jgi:hypothetical protein